MIDRIAQAVFAAFGTVALETRICFVYAAHRLLCKSIAPKHNEIVGVSSGFVIDHGEPEILNLLSLDTATKNMAFREVFIPQFRSGLNPPRSDRVYAGDNFQVQGSGAECRSTSGAIPELFTQGRPA